MSNTRPVTLRASSLHSQATTAEIQRGAIDSFISSLTASSPPMTSITSRVMAVGARQLTVTPSRSSSRAQTVVSAAMPALAAP